MKLRTRLSAFSALAGLLIGFTQPVAADINSEAEQIFNWAQQTYRDLFPVPVGTQTVDNWLYRYYPQTDIYAGVNLDDHRVYVMGGAFGSSPQTVGSVADLLREVSGGGGGSGSNGNVDACNGAAMPPGFSYHQSGNTVTITTNGQCIKLPEDTDLCESNEPGVAGLSVLTEIDNTQSDWRGIRFNDAVIGKMFLSGFAGNTSICTENAPADTKNLIIHQDICLDMTETLEKSALEDEDGELLRMVHNKEIEVNPPITLATKSTIRHKQVPDCSQTDATIIYDHFTGKTRLNSSGSFPIPGLEGGIPNLDDLPDELKNLLQ